MLHTELFYICNTKIDRIKWKTHGKMEDVWKCICFFTRKRWYCLFVNYFCIHFWFLKFCIFDMVLFENHFCIQYMPDMIVPVIMMIWTGAFLCIFIGLRNTGITIDFQQLSHMNFCVQIRPGTLVWDEGACYISLQGIKHFTTKIAKFCCFKCYIKLACLLCYCHVPVITLQFISL